MYFLYLLLSYAEGCRKHTCVRLQCLARIQTYLCLILASTHPRPLKSSPLFRFFILVIFLKSVLQKSTISRCAFNAHAHQLLTHLLAHKKKNGTDTHEHARTHTCSRNVCVFFIISTLGSLVFSYNLLCTAAFSIRSPHSLAST